MSKPNINIQDGFLFQSLKAGRPMSIALLTGGDLEGPIRRFDRFALIIESEGREILVYKHAIATITSSEAADEDGQGVYQRPSE